MQWGQTRLIHEESIESDPFDSGQVRFQLVEQQIAGQQVEHRLAVTGAAMGCDEFLLSA